MKTFKTFLKTLKESAFNVPVVSIEKTEVDLDNDDCINEINKNLSIVLTRDFSNVGDGLNTAKKVLSMYGIELPDVEVENNKKGTIKVSIAQFRSSGENHHNVTPPFFEKNEKHFFVYNYNLKDGKYDVSAEVYKK